MVNVHVLGAVQQPGCFVTIHCEIAFSTMIYKRGKSTKIRSLTKHTV